MPRRLTRRELAPAALGVAVASEAQEERPRSVADTLLEIVKLRYNKQLDGEKLEAVRRSLASGLAAADRLRKMKIDAEPAFSFSANLP